MMNEIFGKIFILVLLASTSVAEKNICKFSDSEVFCRNTSGKFLNYGEAKLMHVMYIVESDITHLNHSDFAVYNSVETISIYNSSFALAKQSNLFGGLKNSLKELRIEFCNVSVNIKQTFAENNLIQNLILTGNKITTVTKDFLGHLYQLKEINLSLNEISYIEVGSFDGLSSLMTLNLTSNKIGGFFDPKFLTLATSQCVVCTVKELHGPCGETDFKKCGRNKHVDQLWWMEHSTEVLLRDNPICSTITENILPTYQDDNFSEIDLQKEPACVMNVLGSCYKHERRRMFLLDVCGAQDYTERKVATESSSDQNNQQDGNIASSNTFYVALIVLGILAGCVIGVMATILVTKRWNGNKTGSPELHVSYTQVNTEDTSIDLECFNTPLHVAAFRGNLIEVGNLMTRENISEVNRDGDTPLHIAAKFNHQPVVEFLAQHEIDINVRNKSKETPLNIAARRNLLDIVKCLVKHKADPELPDMSGKTPLHNAVWHGNTDVVEFLLKTGVNLHALDKEGKSPLFMATKVGHLDIVKLLLESEADVHTTAEDGKTPLHIASWNGSLTAVEILLSYSAIIKQDDNGYTPLHNASRKGHVKVLQLLLSTNHVDVNVADNNGNTPLHQGARGGHLRILELLLSTGANANIRNKSMQTPLHIVEEAQFLDCVDLLRGRV